MEQSQMSELAGWIPENLQPSGRTTQKLTWLQKIKEYDDLESRCNLGEYLINQYQQLLAEALRDRDLHAKVADNWQKYLIEANKKVEKALKSASTKNIKLGTPQAILKWFIPELAKSKSINAPRKLDSQGEFGEYVRH